MEDESKYHDYLNNQKADLSDKEIKKFLDQSSRAQIPPSKRKEEIWKNVDAFTSESNLTPFLMVAASVAVLIVSWFVFLLPEVISSYSTQFAENKNIQLPDGSLVDLGADSELSYNPKWKKRELTLEGEAFFEVEKGKLFTVNTEFGTVKVLGTSFNIISREKQFEVACKTGQVEVSIPSRDFKKVILPGDVVNFNLQNIVVEQASIETIGSWKDGQFYFESKPLSQVLSELERQFDIDLETQGIEGEYFTGYFTNQELATALTMICEPMDLTFAIRSEREVEIRPRNAQ
jgi:transmembrane sensor